MSTVMYKSVHYSQHIVAPSQDNLNHTARDSPSSSVGSYFKAFTSSLYLTTDFKALNIFASVAF